MNARLDTDKLPWSAEAEQSVLGALLLDPNAMLRLADVQIQAQHFFDPRHRDIYGVIAAMTARRLPIDVITVFEELRACGKAESSGGLVYLNELAQCVPSASNIARYAEIVTDKALRRAIVEAADKAQSMANEPGDADAVLDRVATMFNDIARTTAASSPRGIGELAASRSSHWESLANGEVQPGIATGLPLLDSALGGGLKPGRVVTLAARPSVGKTSLATQIGLSVAGRGHSVLLLSLEMQSGDLVDRIAANISGVPLGNFGAGRFADSDWARIAEAMDEISKLPFVIDDQPALTLLQIRAKARQVQQRGGLALLIVDYLQLCSSAGGLSNRHHQIEQISRGMKALAKEMNCCVLLLSQLNRASETDEPELFHLKESGSIEEDADVVLLLHPAGNESDGSLTLLLKAAKNRQGTRGRLALAFDGKTQRWRQSQADVSRRGRS